MWHLNFNVSQETRIAWCQVGACLKNKGDIDWHVLIHPLSLSQQKGWTNKSYGHCQGHGNTCCQVSSSVISTVGWSCSESNQFGRHCMWPWNRNADNVFEKVFEKVKYFRKVFKYKYFSFIKVKYFEILSNANVFDPMPGAQVLIHTSKWIVATQREQMCQVSTQQHRIKPGLSYLRVQQAVYGGSVNVATLVTP